LRQRYNTLPSTNGIKPNTGNNANHYSYAVQTESILSISPPSVTAAGFEAEETRAWEETLKGGKIKREKGENKTPNLLNPVQKC
jgi:hypothetical protein